MVIGEKIRDLRLLCELTQEELADRCELTKGYISQLENDLTSPSIATLIDILSALGTDLQEFFASAEREEKVVFSKEEFVERAIKILTEDGKLSKGDLVGFIGGSPDIDSGATYMEFRYV